MTNNLLRTLAAAAIATAAQAGQGDFRITVDAQRGVGDEDAAVQGFVLLNEGATHTMGVGAVGRAFSMSRQDGNALWGVVTEAINFPKARGHAIGLETAVVNMAHDNDGALRGIDVVYKNRLDVSLHQPVPAVGENRYNERSAALNISAQPRSPAGEYSGWQTGVKFAASSLDRSLTVPYAAAIDLSEVQVAAPVYLLVWRCGEVKCGLAPSGKALTIVVDIDNAR